MLKKYEYILNFEGPMKVIDAFREILFPNGESLVPEQFICPISGKIMQEPVVT